MAHTNEVERSSLAVIEVLQPPRRQPRPYHRRNRRPAVRGVRVRLRQLWLAEYDLLATLPAAVLTKTRHSILPLGVDLFDPPLHGLVLAEAEFTTDTETHDFTPPAYATAEVTNDPRFTGGRLVRASRTDLLSWLDDYDITPTTNIRPSRHTRTIHNS